MPKTIDLKSAFNSVSDVILNRPRPLRDFDQIYMKAGDMVMQSEFVAEWANGKRLAFIGDGDAISVCVAYLKQREILDYGPSKITVFDFDERIVQAVKRFADKERIEHLDAVLYNCFDALPADRAEYDCFYTNPPWGQYNSGESVNVFAQRGMEAIHYTGDGMIVIADDNDDDELMWPKTTLGYVQRFISDRGFFVQRQMPNLHEYHLDDAPGLRSCNLVIRSLPETPRNPDSAVIDDLNRTEQFYGRGQDLRVRYVREVKRLDYGKANETEYKLEQFLEVGE